MARLPTPGGDSGNWGSILNDYLSQVHAPDGTLKTDSVTSDAIAPNAIDSVSIADGSITETLLDTAVQTKLNAVAPVTSVATKTGDVTLTKSDVGLAQVDNTSDATKNSATATLTNKTLTTPKIDSIKDSNGNTITVFGAASSAVNYLTIYNAIAGQSPALVATGSDTDIGWFLDSKGSGSHTFRDGSGNRRLVLTGNSGPNWLSLGGGSTPTMTLSGTDTNIGLTIAPAGNGTITIYEPTGQTAVLRSSGVDTNVDLDLRSKGTGTVQANSVPIVTTTGTQTLTNKTLSSPTITGTVTATTLADATTGPASHKYMTNPIGLNIPSSGSWSPMLQNDIAFNNLRGGSVSVTRNASPLTDGVDFSSYKWFDMGANGYSGISWSSTSDSIVITVTLATSLYWWPYIGIMMGGPYYSKDVTIEGYWSGGWNTLLTSTDATTGFVWYYGAGSSGAAMTQIRYTLTNHNSGYGPVRIYSIFAIDSVLNGSIPTAYMTRSGGNLYGTNAAPPAIISAGGDANIDLKLIAKGSGVVKANNVEVATISGTQTLTNKTITSPTISSPTINDSNGVNILTFGGVASAVNYLSLYNGATGNGPQLRSAGTDSNVNLYLVPKGTGATIFTGNNNATHTFWVSGAGVTTGGNFLTAFGADSGSSPGLTAVNTFSGDANIGINLITKGTGKVQANGVEVATISGTQTLTNKTITGTITNSTFIGGTFNSPNLNAGRSNIIWDYNGQNKVLGITGSAAWSAAVNYLTVNNAATGSTPFITAANSDDTNVSLNLVSKGSGVIQANGNIVNSQVAVPATAGSAGKQGQTACDGSFIYYCISDNTWVRAAVGSW